MNSFFGPVYLCRKMFYKYLREEEKFRFDDLLKFMKSCFKKCRIFLLCQRKISSRDYLMSFKIERLIQWNIFRTIFLGVCPFYLVGDPKKSIYAFRQADIYTYLKAANLISPDHRLSLIYKF